MTKTESNFAFALHFALYFEFEFALYSAHEAPLYGQTISMRQPNHNLSTMTELLSCVQFFLLYLFHNNHSYMYTIA